MNLKKTSKENKKEEFIQKFENIKIFEKLSTDSKQNLKEENVIFETK